MNLVILFEDDFLPGGGRVRLGGRRLRHVLSVKRVGVGDTLRVGLLGGALGIGLVTALDGMVLEMDVALDTPPPPKAPLTLLMALPRPKALNRAIAAATSLGAARIVLLNAWKVEKSYWQSGRLAEANLLHQRVLGLEQAADTVLPELTLERFFTPFVRDRLPGLSAGSTALVADPSAGEPCPADVPGACTLALGPEGGFIPEELSALCRAGFRAVSMGPRILRVETALAALVGRLTPPTGPMNGAADVLGSGLPTNP